MTNFEYALALLVDSVPTMNKRVEDAMEVHGQAVMAEEAAAADCAAVQRGRDTLHASIVAVLAMVPPDCAAANAAQRVLGKAGE